MFAVKIPAAWKYVRKNCRVTMVVFQISADALILSSFLGRYDTVRLPYSNDCTYLVKTFD